MNRLFRHFICVLITALLFAAQESLAEGILPSRAELEGVGLPSLSEALQRYPDSEMVNDDGSVSCTFNYLSDADYNVFSAYLTQQDVEMGQYRVEGSLLIAELKAGDVSFIFTYNSENGRAGVTFPAGTCDRYLQNAKTHLDAARWRQEDGRTSESVREICTIPGYKQYRPAAELLQDNPDLASAVAAREEKLAPFRTIGSTVTFGRYEQDGNTKELEPIEWIVLDYDEPENKTLLLSRKLLLEYPYNQPVNSFWIKSMMRDCLNGSFLANAFNQQEQKAILTTTVDNSATQGYELWSKGSKDSISEDKIFILSYAEANRYLGVSMGAPSAGSRATITSFLASSESLGRDTGNMFRENNWQTEDGQPSVLWFLRSPGRRKDEQAMVSDDGGLSSYPAGWGAPVRPALWLDLNADVF